jgi:transcriptional regulator with XRE-family HTH domain
MLNQEQRQQIHDLSRRGLTQRAIAAEVGCSHPTVSRVLSQPPPPDLVRRLEQLAAELDDVDAGYAATCREAAAAVTSPAAPPAVEDEVEPLPEDASHPEMLRALLAQNQRAYARCVAEGNESAAQRYSRTIAFISGLIAKHEDAARDNDVLYTVTRAEHAAALAKRREWLQNLAAQPLTCSECGVALRVRGALEANGHSPEEIEQAVRQVREGSQ